MTTLDNMIAVIDNIYGINFITRNKMRGAIRQNDLEKLDMLINHNEYDNHIRPDVQVVLSNMLKNLKK